MSFNYLILSIIGFIVGFGIGRLIAIAKNRMNKDCSDDHTHFI